jgi:5-methylcytosine-specific restriction protein B
MTTPYIRSKLRSEEKVGFLNADDLGVAPSLFEAGEEDEVPLQSNIKDDDELLLQVQRLLEDGFGGIIFTGPPGTGKSWYAAEIAAKIAGHSERVRFIQFHASYQYEDFVEGYVPKEEGGFELKDKHLLDMCDKARDAEGEPCVLVIDELSRSDPGRVFGEALTYIESTRRGMEFRLASGNTASIPENLIFLTTMNPADRGVDEVDAALERRFAKIAMDPVRGQLERFLTGNGMEEGLRNRVLSFFDYLQAHDNPYCKVGHAYFRNVKDEDSLRRLWDHQLRFHMEKAFRLDPAGLNAVNGRWHNTVLSAPGQGSSG